MKLILITTFLTINVFNSIAKGPDNSPLSAYSAEWNDPKYAACNTAAHARYLTDDEKQIVYVLNLVRMNPKLFCKTVLPHAGEICKFTDTVSNYYTSLVDELSVLAPLGILTPDSLCYVSAKCHAVTSGKKGYVGHVRQSAECRKKEHFFGECCQYGLSDPLSIVLTLLIDSDVESLGHRHICLGNYTKMSPSLQAHKTYDKVAVLDFY